MKLRIRKKAKDYAQVHKTMLFDQDLSLEAKAIGAFIEMHSDNFGTSFEIICKYLNATENRIRKYIKELDSRCYSCRFQFIPSGEIIWFFDSRRLDFKYVYQEIKNLGNPHQIKLLSNYQKVTGGISDGGYLSPYNNIKPENPISDYEYMQMMVNAEINRKEKSKIKYSKKNYTQKPRQDTS